MAEGKARQSRSDIALQQLHDGWLKLVQLKMRSALDLFRFTSDPKILTNVLVLVVKKEHRKRRELSPKP